jgi:hypothetical protein
MAQAERGPPIAPFAQERGVVGKKMPFCIDVRKDD